MMEEWKTVSDDDILMLWECTTCGEEEAVGPTFYECAGEPQCRVCDEDMQYVCTKIRQPGGK